MRQHDHHDESRALVLCGRQPRRGSHHRYGPVRPVLGAGVPRGPCIASRSGRAQEAGMSAVPGRPRDTSPARVPRVVVLGGGSWGTTVASILARSAPTVLWARSAEVVADVVGGSRNSRYLGDARLHPGLMATASLSDAVRDADVLVMAVPSHAFRQVLEDICAQVRPWIPVV